MPTESPSSIVTDRTISVTGAQAARLDAAAHAGQSRAEQHMKNQPAPIMPTAEDQQNFEKSLAAAQNQDRGSAGFNGERPADTRVDPADDPHFQKPKPGATPAVGAPPEEPKKISVPGLPTWEPKTKEASKHWDELKTRHAREIEQARNDVAAAKLEVQRARESGSPELETLKKELSQYREVLRDVAIERDPGFKQKFEPREKTAIEAAKIAAGEHAQRLEALLKAPTSAWRDEQIQKIVDDLPKSSQIRVESTLKMLDQIDLEKQSEIATQRATFEQKQSTLMGQQKQQQEQCMKELNGAFDATMQEWSDPKNGNPFFVEKDGDKEHNSEVAQSKELAKAIFSGQMEPSDLARAAHWAAMGPRALKGWEAATARAEKAERMLDKIRGVQPGNGRGGSVTETPASGEAPKPGTPAYDAHFRNGIQQAQIADRQRGG